MIIAKPVANSDIRPVCRAALALLLGAAALSACTPVSPATPTHLPTTVPTSAPTVTSALPLSAPDQIGIYAAVLRQLYGPDDTFGGAFQAPVAYVFRQTDDAAGGLPVTPATAVTLSAASQAGITAALADLPTRVIWVDEFIDVPRDSQTGAVAGRGAAFRLGNIVPQADGSVQVAGSIYVASLVAGGTTYVVEKQAGQWVVTGNTGEHWIS